MRIGLILLVLATLLLGACADTNSSSRYRSNSIIDLANTCATCGATIKDDYFIGTNLRAIGPGSY
jgi:hypothetical protein